jgi:hypothetical protein
MSLINKTRDYTIFKKHPNNRGVHTGSVNKLKFSITTSNLLHLRPILCNVDMQVLDGQHRLEAARQLGVDIFYEIDPNTKTTDIVLLNDNQKKWTITDYFEYYRTRNFEEYVKTKRIMKDLGVDFLLLLAINKSQQGHEYEKIKAGLFKLRTDVEEIKKLQNFYNEVCEIITKRLPIRTGFVKNQSFMCALFGFIANRYVNKETFLEKLSQKIEWISSRSSISGYEELFKNIYSYRNKHVLKLL